LLWGDNQGAIRALKRGWSRSCAFLGRAVGLRLALIGDLVREQILDPQWRETTLNTADGFTKRLGRIAIRSWWSLIGMRNIPVNAERVPA